MKLKAKILVGMLALLTSATVVMPSAGAMNGTGAPAARGVDVAASRDSLVFPMVRGTVRETLVGAAINKNLPRILELVGNAAQDISANDAFGNTIWHVLISNRDWSIIRRLLGVHKGTDALDVATVKRCQKSFVACINKKNNDGDTPFSFVSGDVSLKAQLKNCIPGDLPANLARRLPPVLNTFRI